MSIEVAAQRYLFVPPKRNPDIHAPKSAADLKKILEERQNEQRLSWTYNHLHDLESLWWVVVWIIFHNCFSMPGGSDSDLQEVPEHLRMALFPHLLYSIHRRDSFTIPSSNMHYSLPKSHQKVFFALDYLRWLLIQHYRKVESTLPHSINLDASDDEIYQTFMEQFNAAQLNCPNYTLTFVRQLRAEMSNSKREREESTGDTGHHSIKRRAVD